MRDEEFKQIVFRDPRLAWALRTSPSPVLQVMQCEGLFESGAVRSTTQALMAQPIPEDVYVCDLAYEVSCPNANAGSLFKGQQDVANALSPGIRAKIQVTGGYSGGPNYLVNNEFMPIEALARHTSIAEGGCCSWANGWLLTMSQQLIVDMILNRAYVGGEIPCTVSFFLRYQALGCQYSLISLDGAVAGLQGLGYTVPKTPPRRGR